MPQKYTHRIRHVLHTNKMRLFRSFLYIPFFEFQPLLLLSVFYLICLYRITKNQERKRKHIKSDKGSQFGSPRDGTQ